MAERNAVNHYIYDWNTAGTGYPHRDTPVELNDETLRDGLQSPSVRDPSIGKKIELLHLMAQLGIHAVDLGLPGAGPRARADIVELCREIQRSNLAISPNCAVRTALADVRALIEIADLVGMPIEACTFIGSSAIRQYAEEWSLDHMLKLTEDAVSLAVAHGLPVMFVTEDTTRAAPDTIRRLYKTAIEAGARRVCITDTVGHITPRGVRNLIPYIRQLIHETGEDIKLDWHGHNDRGLGVINTITAMTSGVDRLHATALGLGERVGNCSMDQLLVNLRLMGYLSSNLEPLRKYVDTASEATGVPIPANYPVFGIDAFRTATGVHAAAIIKAKKKDDGWLADRIYSGVPAAMVGTRQRIEVGFMSGVSNVVYWLNEHGFEPDEHLVAEVFRAAKEGNRVMSDDEVEQIVRFVTSSSKPAPAVVMDTDSGAPAKASKTVRLTPGKRILFLTKDPETVRRQLRGELDLQMKDVRVEDLMDDINTDAMAPAWACFDYRPDALARSAYAGITVNGERLFWDNALIDGNFEVIVSGKRKGVGSSRETAVQAEKYAGIRIAIADGFAPIHARNNINSGVLMAGHDVLERLQAGEEVPLGAFMTGRDPVTRLIIQAGGLFAFTRAVAKGEAQLPVPTTGPRPMTIAEKVLLSRMATAAKPASLKPGDAVAVTVDGGFSHDFTSAQVHYFLTEEYGEGYTLKNPSKFAVFEDHMLYAQDMPSLAKFRPKLLEQSERQRAFQAATGVRAFLAKDGVSPGICHTVAREKMIEPGDFIQATDSHTCMGGSLNSLAYGVGATEYAALVYSGITFTETPGSIRFELMGALRAGVTAKDVMLFILKEYAKPGKTLDLVMEFGGPGLAALSPDERATMANMATECTAKAGVFEGDEAMIEWIAAHRPGVDAKRLRAQIVSPDPGAEYVGGVHTIDLSSIEPMVATPGDAAMGIPSDPTNGALIKDIGDVRIDIAYGGSCTAGKEEDLDMYARVMTQALRAGKRVAPSVNFFIQFGSESVEAYATAKGYLEVFAKTGVHVIKPGCGACIGCGPGISESKSQVTVSAINRNYQNRSGPGALYLASPLTVAASAVMGKIVAYDPKRFEEAFQ